LRYKTKGPRSIASRTKKGTHSPLRVRERGATREKKSGGPVIRSRGEKGNPYEHGSLSSWSFKYSRGGKAKDVWGYYYNEQWCGSGHGENFGTREEGNVKTARAKQICNV